MILPGHYGRQIELGAAYRREQQAFVSATLFLTALSLIAIWLPRFPAMQDYPQHLFMAQVLSTFNDAGLRWSEYYTATRTVEHYSLFFLLVQTAAMVFPIGASGKVFITTAILLLNMMVFSWNHINKTAPVWSLLLVFPLFFCHVYYMWLTFPP